MRVVLVGGGGHASDVLGALEALAASGSDVKAVGFVADDPPPPDRFRERSAPWLGSTETLSSADATHYVLAIGWPGIRQSVHKSLDLGDLEAATLIHPKAEVGSAVAIGRGSVVLDGAHISATASIGEHSYVAYLAAVGHDDVIGDFVSVMPGAILSGNVVVGDGVLIGSNATVREGITIGTGATVGAGSVVLNDVPAGATVVGVPAHLLH